MGNNSNNNVEIPKWLQGLPMAPVFHPTDTEFADPIAYISRIEKEASAFGICKIVPPLPKPSKKYVFGNLNKSLSKCSELGSDVNLPDVGIVAKVGCSERGNEGEARAVFTTRHQELGQSVKRIKGVVNNDNLQLGVQKQVWQSGEVYTLEQFESKSKAFARSLLSVIKEVSPLVIEALFWKAASEKPIYVEYANDVPGSGFGEPEGQFRYFHRRRRKVTSWKSYRNRGKADEKNIELESARSSHNDQITHSSDKNDLETPTSSMTSSTIPFDENLRSSRRKSVTGSNDVEGTAGWKLSNSPWNLQVIARSPGSLTRFMPDDIPGVTSPMVYIGMLFSWFAWHVEDHELHSMNFLHTGAPKTWYAVPGDYAFTFEEVIRNEAYGGDIDRLAALSLLGEKTTLISPEVIVASGIPCCRLVQNPGEFVVTFPRAYHAGFSHGFNCGEAANFGTPQWLMVAKEAAVRRAAMNYLPMLSHQQLLYLLTMSFISRVPRSLLPGARSSRLRDRQKEERELLVKKAFVEDILKENNILSVLLGRQSTFNAVLWNADLLPCQNRESQMPSANETVYTTTGETVPNNPSVKQHDQNNLLDEMNLYMETLNDPYMGDDDISRDFQIDSGALACVACGILGFPFMSVVQLSERASMEVLADLVEEGPGVTELKNTHHYANLNGSVKSSVSDDLCLVPDISLLQKDLSVPSITKSSRIWNTSNKYLRPRIFCLEHAGQIEEMLRSKGGADILVICHSDYQKIKAHAAAVAEEIGSPFNYIDIPLDAASEEDLHLIDLAIDDGELDECREDWTSKLGINLRHCVKVRKNSPSMHVQHALSLGDLFSEKSLITDFSKIKWQFRRSRSKIKLYHRAHSKPCQSIEIKKDEVIGGKLDGAIVKKEEKLIQYSRRKFKQKPDLSTRACGDQVHPREILPEVSAATCDNLDEHNRSDFEINPAGTGNSGSISAGSIHSPIGISEGLHDVPVREATSNLSLNYSPSRVADSLATATLVVDSIEQNDNEPMKELNIEDDICHIATCKSVEMQQNSGTDVTSEKTEISHHTVASNEEFRIMRSDQITETMAIKNEKCNLASEGHCRKVADKDVLMIEVSGLANSASFHVACSPLQSLDAQIDLALDNSFMISEACDHMISDNEVQQNVQSTNGGNDVEPISCDHKLIDEPPASTGEGCEDMREIWTGEPLQDNLQHESNIGNESNEEIVSSSVTMMNQPTSSPLEISEVPSKECAAADLCNVGTKQKLISGSVSRMEVDQSLPLKVGGCSEVPIEICTKEDSGADMTLDPGTRLQNHTTTEANVDELICNSSSQLEENERIPASIVACSEEPSGVFAEEKLDVDMTIGSGLQELAQTKNATNEEPKPSSLIPINQPVPAVIRKYSRTRRESYSAEKFCNGNEAYSSKDNRERECNESNLEDPSSSTGKGRKRNRELEQLTENKFNGSGFIRSPCEGLRPRAGKDAANTSEVDIRKIAEKPAAKTMKNPKNVSAPWQDKKKILKGHHRCDLDGCRMSFETKRELSLHKRNRCPHEGCGKRFSSHKYALIHQRVHDDERPLKCPWKGCSMSFKWAWARTEHIRVHTGERPYKCKFEGCGLSFRFVSDISRHRRKTGHYENLSA